jgi:DNA-binding transcriptional MerR regulator
MTPPESSSSPSASAAEYTIDELTAASGVPSRTIRFYQSSGVLPKPDKRGRVAYYGPPHVERLALIGRLQDRGLRMRAIRDVVERIEAGELQMDEWLGLEAQLRSSWVDDTATMVDDERLRAMIGEQRPGFVADLKRAKLLTPQGDGQYLVASPGLLKVATHLEAQGVDADTAKLAREILEKHLGRAAKELAKSFFDRLTHDSDSLAEATAKVEQLKPVAHDAVRLIFAREMERVLRSMLESGVATRAAKANKGRKPRKKR